MSILRRNPKITSGSPIDFLLRNGRSSYFSASPAILALGCVLQPTSVMAAPLPTADSLVSVCSGVSLPPSVVTGIIDPVVTGIYDPIEGNVNQLLAALGVIPGLPGDLNVDVSGLLTAAAGGSPITLEVLNQNNTVVGPSDQCDAAADSYTLDTPAGIAIGGNQITGLGANGQQAVAGEIESIAIGNRAETEATADNSIAFGPDAYVADNADGSVALGSNAQANVANSVALGADSIADRGALAGVSVGEISVGSPGNERQITNVADATEDTDAVNLRQLNASVAAGNPLAVLYDSIARDTITLLGASGTLITNVAPGALNALSTDAVNGSQLYATNVQVDLNTQAIIDIQTTLGGGGGGGGGGSGPIDYSNNATPTTPNGGTPTQDATLVGAAPGPVGLHNVADGVIAHGSTDAVNGGQLYDYTRDMIGEQVAAMDAVTYDDPSHTTITLNNGGTATRISNLADGVDPNDAVNVRQLGESEDRAVTRANSYTDTKFASFGDQLDNINYDLRKVGKDASAGTAAALAASGMPQSMDAGRSMIAGGIGVYRGKVGFAVGGSFRTDNGQSVFKVGVTYDSSSHVGASAGAGFQF